jgi:hypothetical protein
MVRIPPFQGGGPGSIPGVGSWVSGVLAQVVERALSMREVGGSMPPYSIFLNCSLVAQLVRACDC